MSLCFSRSILQFDDIQTLLVDFFHGPKVGALMLIGAWAVGTGMEVAVAEVMYLTSNLC